MDAAAPSARLASRLISAAVVLACALALMWTALVDHRPAVFFDTEPYHLQGGLFARDLGLIGPAEARRLLAEETPEQRAVNDTVMGARSPVYGLFLYATQRLGGLWLTALVQCLAAAWTMFVLLRAAAPRAGPLACGAVIAAAAAVTGLPFFASLILPDVFAGLALLAAAGLLVYLDRLSLVGRVSLAAMIGLACAFHPSDAPLLVLVALAGGVVLLAGRAGWPQALKRAGWVALAAIVGVVAVQGAFAVHRAVTGETLRRPPFIMVRLLADGPGRAYLRHACAAASPYELCRFKTLPLDNTEDMLWSDDPAKGIMNTSDHDQRVRLEREETRFALGVLAYDPFGQAAASLRNWSGQLAAAHVEEPLRDPSVFFGRNYFSHTSLPGMIPNNRDCRPGGAGCKPPFSMRGLIWLHQGALLLALGFLGWRLTRADGLSTLGARPVLIDSDLGRLTLFMVLTVFAILANAAVCGVLSGPFPRYQARVIWLAPLMAGVAALCLGLAPGWRGLEEGAPRLGRLIAARRG